MSRLTENEKVCLRRRLRHETAKEMAIALGISPHAVEKRLKMARLKLGVSSSVEAARWLFEDEEYGRLVPRAPDLAPRVDVGHDEITAAIPAAPRQSRAAGVSAMLILALLLSSSDPQAGAAPNARPRLPGTERAEDVAFRPASAAEVHAFLADSFATMDLDGSGFIERAEAPSQGVQVGSTRPAGEPPAPGDKVTWVTGTMGQAMWISSVDADGDGRVSEAEWIKWNTPFSAARGVPANWRGVAAAEAAAKAHRRR